MKATELIVKLAIFVEHFGDREVYINDHTPDPQGPGFHPVLATSIEGGDFIIQGES